MGTVERIFGLLIVATLFAVGAFIALKNDGLANVGKGSDAPIVTASNLGNGQLATPCGCFDAAYKISSREAVTSPAYRSGFLRCRNIHGTEGGDLWTAGWKARKTGMGGRKGGCKAFQGRSG
ncbi:MAG: hypothetical protein AAF527_08575 [Pseudomonadota bacterium]